MNDKLKDAPFTIEWRDAGRAPRCAPNPDYPDGIHLDFTRDAAVTCKVELPYPARQCGAYLITCNLCGTKAACTTAGRPDDPRSIKIPCKDAAIYAH
jgi:hypothetical protein